MAEKTKIVLDSDVIIHFMKADRLSTLIDIFSEYQYIVLDVVYDELKKYPLTRTVVENLMKFFPKRVSSEKFSPTGSSIREYAMLVRTLGKGESACMIYCRDHQDVLGSSNLRDIKDYCTVHGITYLTTLDFLYYAIVRGKMTAEECNSFIAEVNAKGSRLPSIDMNQYISEVVI